MSERELEGQTGEQDKQDEVSPSGKKAASEVRPEPDADLYRRDPRPQPAKPMGEWLRLATAGALAIILGLGLLSIFEILWQILAVIFLGITIAGALNPIVSRLDQGRIPRALAVITIYIILVGIVVIIGFVIVPPLIVQGQRLIDSAPEALDALEGWLNEQGWLLDLLDVGQIDQIEPLAALTEGLTSVGSALLSVPGAIVTLIGEVLLMLFVSIYGLILAHDVADYVGSLFPPKKAANVLHALGSVVDAMGGYLRGLLIDGSILALVTYLGLMLIGVNFPLVLGVLVGLGEIVPIAGPLIAGSLIVVVALFQSLQTAIIALVFVLILQQFESNVLVPIIMKSQVHISPLLTLMAIAIGGTLGGFMGAIVAVPVAAALTALVRVAIAPAIRRHTGAAPREEEEG